VATDWCISSIEALDEDVCYVLPALAADKPRRLLVYLHGITPPTASSPQKDNVQTAVLRASTRAGAAALVPRGRRGIGPEGAKDWWAWPTSPDAHARLAGEIVLRIAEAKKKLEALAGAPFERVYFAGSSNGAYFLSTLALRGDLAARGITPSGFGAMSGGAAGGIPASAVAGRAPEPFYVGFGTYDEETKRNAKGLVATLQDAHWPVRVAEHPFGHGAREIYLDEAFGFWDDPR